MWRSRWRYIQRMGVFGAKIALSMPNASTRGISQFPRINREFL